MADVFVLGIFWRSAGGLEGRDHLPRAADGDGSVGVAMKTLSNYTNHITHTPTDPAFEKFDWKRP